MKYQNLVFVASIMIGMVACNGNAKKTTHIEASESMEVEDELITESNEVEYLESAMNALEEGNSKRAVQKIMDAVNQINGYVGEMDDPSDAKIAISVLIDLAEKIKSGVKMTADDLEEALLKLDFFSEDDIDFDDEGEDIDYNDSEEE